MTVSIDPRRRFVEMVGRLSQKTQVHLDQQQRHVEINRIIVIGITILLMIIAVYNMYFIKVLYQDLNGIVSNMDSMHTSMTQVTHAMDSITTDVQSFERNMRYMTTITEHTDAMSEMLPDIGSDMHSMSGDMSSIERNMGLMSIGMTAIDRRFGEMTRGVANMRGSVRQISRPMGILNPFLP